MVLGHNTGALVLGLDPYRRGLRHRRGGGTTTSTPIGLIYKVRNNRDLFNHLYEKRHMDDDPDLVVVSYGTPSRVVNTAVEKARAGGLKVGALRLINLWPFPG